MRALGFPRSGFVQQSMEVLTALLAAAALGVITLERLGMRKLWLVIICLSFIACDENHEGVSYSLKAELNNIEVSCQFLEKSKFSKGYWVRSELDGWGLLVVTKDNAPNSYTLALMAHGHERALETREIECEKL